MKSSLMPIFLLYNMLTISLAVACKETKPSELASLTDEVSPPPEGIPFYLSILKEMGSPTSYRIELAGLQSNNSPRIGLPKGWDLDSQIPQVTAPGNSAYQPTGEAIRLLVRLKLLKSNDNSQTSTSISSDNRIATTTNATRTGDPSSQDPSPQSNDSTITNDQDQSINESDVPSQDREARYCGTEKQSPQGVLMLEDYASIIYCDKELAKYATTNTQTTTISSTSTGTSNDAAISDDK